MGRECAVARYPVTTSPQPCVVSPGTCRGSWSSVPGPGMPRELLATVTERFARSPQARARPGSGLGLSLLATIVTDAGGQLRLCYDGHHRVVGVRKSTPCTHDSAMTVTILLPSASRTHATWDQPPV